MTAYPEPTDARARTRIHPLTAAAAISVIALSLTGIAAITSLIGQPRASGDARA